MGVNYGLNKVRFVAPVPGGSKIRGRFTPAEVTDVEDGGDAGRLAHRRRARGRHEALRGGGVDRAVLQIRHIGRLRAGSASNETLRRGSDTTYVSLTGYERSRHRRQFPHAARQVVSRIVQHDAARRPGGPRHPPRPRQGAVARSRGSRRSDPRLRPAARRGRAQHRARRGAARRPAGDDAGRHREPLLQLGPAGDRPGGAHGPATKAWRPRSAAASSRSR